MLISKTLSTTIHCTSRFIKYYKDVSCATIPNESRWDNTISLHQLFLHEVTSDHTMKFKVSFLLPRKCFVLAANPLLMYHCIHCNCHCTKLNTLNSMCLYSQRLLYEFVGLKEGFMENNRGRLFFFSYFGLLCKSYSVYFLFNYF